ncbi:SRPBCC family protein [Sphaerotilaceae bacterium SBD11-9]
MFKKIALVIVALIAAVLLYATTRPDTFSVQRSALIKAPADKVFAQINDFHAWQAWSPWEKLDPGMQRTHSGAPAGKGAAYAWKGNSKVGEGRMEIVESVPASKLSIKLDFIEPFEGHNVADFTLQPQGDATQVTWVMHGPAPYVTKLMGLFVSMDSMIGKDFEAGLANLKTSTEK